MNLWGIRMKRFVIQNNTVHIRHLMAVMLILAAVAGCTVSAEDQALYNSSMVMAQQGQKEQAWQNMQGLCVKFPDDKRFCADAAMLKSDIYEENMSFVKSRLSDSSLVPVSSLKAAGEKLEKAAAYTDNDAEVNAYRAKLQTAQKYTSEKTASEKAAAEKAAADGDFFKAYDHAASMKNIDPAVFGPMADEYSAKAASTVMPELEKLMADDDLGEAKKLIEKLKMVSYSDPKLAEYAASAAERDKPDYYMAKGNEAAEKGELETAVKYYRRALVFPDVRAEAQQALDKARMQQIEVQFMKGLEFASQELNNQAYERFMNAFDIMKGLPLEMRTMVAIPKDELEQYYDNMFFLGQKAMDEDRPGQAYLYFGMLYDLVPSYHGLRNLKQTVEDRVLARALKSIAVIPFKSPASEPELGMQVTSNIMQILQKALSNDIKIIERGALEVLLREYELAVAGSLQGNQNTDSFSIKSADYLLMGEVLDSRTETNVQNSKKKVRVKISENKIRNIEWEDWAKESEQLQKENKPVPPEPEKYIMQPVYDYAEYDVAFHEKVSYLSISYRVVETSQGRVVHSNTVRAQKEVKDDATTGIDLGSYKIDMKAANLPTDIELSNIVRREAIDRISSEVMQRFENQDEKYIAAASGLESSNNLQDAVETYADAIVLMEKKGKNFNAVKAKAGKYLDVLSLY